ncbi:hypothetical protein HanXRQr2_Chr13g0572121 [Helianthus annuus]|uniref:Uncharacterized protein n=1 Tax=Helianthus annuus TaxID=4232 RepID=A0A9K3EEE0_HELAN|nr:hypothetical protein HanXRQr2_Chr13g0572121 [Helianthus annuus]KAJ0496516.1 hypothetical protein HanHA89_Chr13g0500701 [Helianthus annuus]
MNSLSHGSKSSSIKPFSSLFSFILLLLSQPSAAAVLLCISNGSSKDWVVHVEMKESRVIRAQEYIKLSQERMVCL